MGEFCGKKWSVQLTQNNVQSFQKRITRKVKHHCKTFCPTHHPTVVLVVSQTNVTEFLIISRTFKQVYSYKTTNILIVVIKHNLLPRDQEQTSWNYIQACSEEALPTKSKILLLGKLQYPRNRQCWYSAQKCRTLYRTQRSGWLHLLSPKKICDHHYLSASRSNIFYFQLLFKKGGGYLLLSFHWLIQIEVMDKITWIWLLWINIFVLHNHLELSRKQFRHNNPCTSFRCLFESFQTWKFAVW